MEEVKRKLASIRIISEIRPIEGADSIELAIVDGWQCVVKKGEFKAGDLCVYFEIDSFLPIRPEFEFLRKSSYKKMGDKEGFRLRTIKLRGQISQGLVLNPDEVLPRGITYSEGEDFTEILNILKYEPPIPACMQGKVKGNFPSFIRKTDLERVQNIWGKITANEQTLEILRFLDKNSDKYINYGPLNNEDEEDLSVQEFFPVGTSKEDQLKFMKDLIKKGLVEDEGCLLGMCGYVCHCPYDFCITDKGIELLKNNDQLYEVTVKLDGTSATYYMKDGKFGVCSRNLDLEEDENNVYWKMARKYEIEFILKSLNRNVAFQGEIIGEGIQGNPEGIKGQEFYLFDIWDIDEHRYLNHIEKIDILVDYGPNIRWCPLIEVDIKEIYPFVILKQFDGNIDKLLEFANGKSLHADVREGLVFKGMETDQRFKVISNEYLLKGK